MKTCTCIGVLMTVPECGDAIYQTIVLNPELYLILDTTSAILYHTVDPPKPLHGVF